MCNDIIVSNRYLFVTDVVLSGDYNLSLTFNEQWREGSGVDVLFVAEHATLSYSLHVDHYGFLCYSLSTTKSSFSDEEMKDAVIDR